MMELLPLLCCPLTRQPLRPATADELKKCPVKTDAGLTTQDGRTLYPIRNGIPLLVAAEGISLDAG